MQKAAREPHHQNPRKSRARIIETRLEAAWNEIGGGMKIDEFIAAAQDAAAVICLRSTLEGKLSSRAKRRAM